jgi:alpha-amylase
MDFETFGEHQWEDTGIFEFMKALPREVLKHPDFDFTNVTEAASRYPVRETYDAHAPVTWADTERDLTAWMGNDMQREALRMCYSLEQPVYETGDREIIEDWRRLTTSDHFYYMCTKYFADGDVHKYFSPYDSPYEAFMAYNNALMDLRSRLHGHSAHKPWYENGGPLADKN